MQMQLHAGAVHSSTAMSPRRRWFRRAPSGDMMIATGPGGRYNYPPCAVTQAVMEGGSGRPAGFARFSPPSPPTLPARGGDRCRNQNKNRHPPDRAEQIRNRDKYSTVAFPFRSVSESAECQMWVRPLCGQVILTVPHSVALDEAMP